MIVAGIETGGTKVIAAIARAETPGVIRASLQVPTTTPAEVAVRVRRFLDAHREDGSLQVGIAAFGPLDLDTRSTGYGTVTTTTKPGWSGARAIDLIGPADRATIVSDVTGAAIGEYAYGATAGVRSTAHLTVGTGIGAGVLLDGAPVSHLSHPELGHVSVRRHADDDFAGVCPFHGDCVEGLASGPAMSARWRRSSHDLGEHLDAAVDMEAFYLAQLIATTCYAFQPERISIGGGVLKVPGLLDAVRIATIRELGGALGPTHPSSQPALFLVPPALGDLAGVLGALHLAAAADNSLLAII